MNLMKIVHKIDNNEIEGNLNLLVKVEVLKKQILIQCLNMKLIHNKEEMSEIDKEMKKEKLLILILKRNT